MFFFSFFQHYAVSRKQQGRQRKPSIKTLGSPLSAEFWKYCVLSGGTQHHNAVNMLNIEKENIKKQRTESPNN